MVFGVFVGLLGVIKLAFGSIISFLGSLNIIKIMGFILKPIGFKIAWEWVRKQSKYVQIIIALITISISGILIFYFIST